MNLPPNHAATNYRIIFVLLFLIAGGSVSFGQMVTPMVVNTNGFSGQMIDGYISNSVGESAITTLHGSTAIITQGFLQPELIPPCSDFELNYYPNPVYDFITIRDTACGNIIKEVEIFNLLGNKVLQTRLSNRKVDLRTLGVGIFIVRGYSGTGGFLGSFKIVKITD